MQASIQFESSAHNNDEITAAASRHPHLLTDVMPVAAPLSGTMASPAQRTSQLPSIVISEMQRLMVQDRIARNAEARRTAASVVKAVDAAPSTIGNSTTDATASSRGVGATAQAPAQVGIQHRPQRFRINHAVDAPIQVHPATAISAAASDSNLPDSLETAISTQPAVKHETKREIVLVRASVRHNT